MIVKLTDPRVFIQLEQIADDRGKLTDTLKKVYAMNKVRAHRRKEAAAPTATK